MGCATTGTVETTGEAPGYWIKPGGILEECRIVSPNQELVYSFQAAMPVDFNLHYHHEKKVLYPVSKKRIFDLEGTFSPEEKYNYCLMWTNPHRRSVGIDHAIEIVDK